VRVEHSCPGYSAEGAQHGIFSPDGEEFHLSGGAALRLQWDCKNKYSAIGDQVTSDEGKAVNHKIICQLTVYPGSELGSESGKVEEREGINYPSARGIVSSSTCMILDIACILDGNLDRCGWCIERGQ
jgi:hypothetical protein